MVNRQRLLDDLKPLLKQMEADLRARCDEVGEINDGLKREYEQARAADRTGAAFEEWRADLITQVAVAWVLSCVFVRFLEDNELISPPRISGRVSDQPSAVSGQQSLADSRKLKADNSAGMARARDERDLYFRSHPKDTDRDYLLSVFDDLARLPGTKDVFGPHNPVSAYRNWLSGDAAQKLIEFFQRIDTDGTGELIHDFSSGQWSEARHQRSAISDQQDQEARPSRLKADKLTADSSCDSFDDTRFLGDLYQDLSEAARKKYALLQTPEFVEKFILDRTLEPALDEFGLDGGSSQRSAVSSQPGNAADGRKLTADSSKASGFRMIDPACGSGHFLLGSFARILARWRKQEPGTPDRELVNRALASIHGVDLNPYALAIARFRLLIAAMRECQVTRLKDAPAFRFNLACGDSLLHGPAFAPSEEKGTAGAQQLMSFHELAHVYQTEDLDDLHAILTPGRYHAVVANPPYITPKDKALNQAYRQRHPEVCHMKYSLSVPFMQRLFDLACEGGYTGQITANSFMKREFGKKLVESYLPKIDLTHVIDTSGAYIPGHGTPTVILFGRSRTPVAQTIRAVMGIKGEPATPKDPAHGLVWTAIIRQIDQPGSQSAFVSVGDTPREQFGKHPWSIGGGGAAELKGVLDETAEQTLSQTIAHVGFMAITGEDDVFVLPTDAALRLGVPTRPFGIGDAVRDWTAAPEQVVFFPYRPERTLPCATLPSLTNAGTFLWPHRTVLRARSMFGKTMEGHGFTWYEYIQFIRDRAEACLSIVFGFVATHNHFVLDRGGKVFKQSAPVIKLPPDATEDDHLALLGLLNSSTACFWMKQMAHNKGSTVDDKGARQRTAPFEDFWEFTATQLQSFPLPAERPLAMAQFLDRMARHRAEFLPGAVLDVGVPTPKALETARAVAEDVLGRMIAAQEELDWQCYRLYGLIAKEPLHTGDVLPAVQLGERAFEIVLARKVAAGEEETTWFVRHGSKPKTEMPADWPEEYKRVVQRRIEIIESDRNIALIERPEYKRRWNTEPWEAQQERALRNWLLDRLESYFDLDGRMNPSKSSGPATKQSTARGELREPRLTSVARLADLARQDSDFMQVAELYTDRMDFDVAGLGGELVAAESVPALPVLRYKPSGLDKRAAWERTWELQRLEDAVDALFEVDKLSAISSQPSAIKEATRNACATLPFDAAKRELLAREIEAAAGYVVEAARQNADLTSEAVLKPVTDAAKRAKKAVVGDIPVPPKYTSADFQNGNYWRLRGKLDVPKERWVSFPNCEGEDGTLVIAWAGYDHLQLARAIAERYELAKEQEGRKLVPLLAAIGQLIPWLKQWHNDVDPTFGTRMGDYFEGYLAEEAKALGLTVADVMAWTPPAKVARRKARSKQR